jgi:hypothetical protein
MYVYRERVTPLTAEMKHSAPSSERRRWNWREVVGVVLACLIYIGAPILHLILMWPDKVGWWLALWGGYFGLGFVIVPSSEVEIQHEIASR